ncbi:MAG: hypothetical protein IJ113_07980 [Eggerthellaceae bacterium]|nr:hypothetical protein [Eggerthellaceae bacterium]
MASDYGDESGEKMLDSFTRFAERRGEFAMRERAYEFKRACRNATEVAKEKGGESEALESAPEWAKLDMREFQALEDYADFKEIIEAKLDAHGIEPNWFTDEQAGREYLLFRVKDAREVWASFKELEQESDGIAEKAAEAAKDKVAEKHLDRDERPLDERAKQAREASKALEAERTPGLEHDRAERAIETRVK